jgi:hypothetical protein
VPRSDIPAVTHVDYSARVQTVSRETIPDYHDLIALRGAHGLPVLVNTSFNVRGEPIVCTPEDAYRCFMRTDIARHLEGDDARLHGRGLLPGAHPVRAGDAVAGQEAYRASRRERELLAFRGDHTQGPAPAVLSSQF